MNRRSFLSSCLALAAAPAIVRADSLMRIVPRKVAVIVPNDAIWLRQTTERGIGGIWFRFYKSIDGETRVMPDFRPFPYSDAFRIGEAPRASSSSCRRASARQAAFAECGTPSESTLPRSIR